MVGVGWVVLYKFVTSKEEEHEIGIAASNKSRLLLTCSTRGNRELDGRKRRRTRRTRKRNSKKCRIPRGDVQVALHFLKRIAKLV